MKKQKITKELFNKPKFNVEAPFALDPFSLPPDVKEEFEKKGWTPRWLNADTIITNSGYHPKGWQVFKRETPKKDSQSFLFGSDPDGYIRRGKSILGYKTNEDASKHKKYLRHIANEQKFENLRRKEKEKMKQMLIDQKMDEIMSVHEGYED
ncbi:MAG: hypothetical protein GTN36_05455 [Candidatus Aenigmarchaeota archaeon]|nr:hypothetical protein [Candidatus Aenigmarchaeota archaeon]